MVPAFQLDDSALLASKNTFQLACTDGFWSNCRQPSKIRRGDPYEITTEWLVNEISLPIAVSVPTISCKKASRPIPHLKPAGNTF